ncbi:MAG: AI-2E family transporter [Puniceicoccales bacterium]|jgi:predicted PurR-regulated permease PerM|nr:AI-2E family transporter [Puniceicoccales bacterium]
MPKHTRRTPQKKPQTAAATVAATDAATTAATDVGDDSGDGAAGDRTDGDVGDGAAVGVVGFPAGLLSPAQRKVCGVAAVCVAVGVIAAFAGGVFWLLGKFLAVFSTVLWPLIIAALLSLLLQPLCKWLEDKLRLPRVPAVALLYIGVAALCALLALLVLPVVIGQLAAFAAALPALWGDISRFAETNAGEVRGWLEQTGFLAPVAQAASAPAAAVATGAAANAAVAASADAAGRNAAALPAVAAWLQSFSGAALPALTSAGGHAQAFFAKVAGAAIVPVYLFYLLNTRRDFLGDLRSECAFLPDWLRDDLAFLARQFADITVAYFRGQLFIGAVLGVVLAAGFTVAGLRFGLLIGLCVGLLNVVPYLGTMLGLGVALPLAYFQQGGGTGTLFAVLAVFAAAQIFEGYWLTPRVMRKTTGLHPMVIIFSVFFWGAAFGGLLGMVLAVPLTAFFAVFWRLAKTKYLPTRVPR